MNTQHEHELEKNTDDDFDFFKQNKSSAPQKNNVSLEKNINQQVKEKSEAELKLQKRIAFSGIFIPMFLVITLSPYQTEIRNFVQGKKQDTQLVKQSEVVKPIEVVAQQTNNKEQPFNVDYSKLSKEDAERVKYALDQFGDIQKTLIETSKPK